MTIQDHALKYLNLGLPVLPVGVNKVASIKWKKNQKKLPTESEIKNWPPFVPGISFVTGELSGIVVLDIESSVDLKEFVKIYPLPPTVISKTGSGGYHYYFKHPGYEITDWAKRLPGVDFRGDGGYVVLPPSCLKNGQYEWLTEFNRDDLAEMPEWLKEVCKRTVKKDWGVISKGVPEGQRNDTAASFVGKLLKAFPVKDWESAVWPIIKGWNFQNKPPEEEKVIRSVFDSIASRELSKTNEKELPEPISFADLCNKKLPPQKWLVDKLFTIGSVNQVSGAPNHGKTFTTQHMAIRIAKGEKVFDHFETTQSGVLIVNEEDNEALIQERSKLLEKETNIPIHFYIQLGLKLEDQTVEDLIRRMHEKNLKVIIFDSLSTIHTADEINATQMGFVFDQLAKFVREGFTVIFTHHHRKKPHGKEKDDVQEQTRGSTVINARIAGHLVCEEVKIDGTRYFLITQAKLKAAKKIEPFLVSITEADGIALSFARDYQSGEEETSRIKDEILEIGENGWLPFEFYLDKKIGKERAVRDALNLLAQRGYFEKKNLKDLKNEGILDATVEGSYNKAFYRRLG